MRLLYLDLTAQTWRLENFHGKPIPFYAVLSHTWGEDNEETSFEDFEIWTCKLDISSKPGCDKLRFCHKLANETELRYLWIDTCCIKKSDSSEFQRSLNSMFYWYQKASRCFVYLSDMTFDDFGWEKFAQNGWFARCWTAGARRAEIGTLSSEGWLPNR
ncbi:hypothetical protein BU25DRAFT_466388 [Macroventuria anomochaeta]|uniref:Uncharacterized protein n=1 Tax=Macroventuria anomochaeta TaxID=301207 RepID=A0ACB6S317_9PLEO|nr:uncharacterized protein BU25DRAFT_466388 [Macroventuria anomochaeta]KAF2628635.1 hypothetical protein BU25DRAFT_466388 [Macroventuria anomochaeta]